MFKTINSTIANLFVSYEGYRFKDISDSDKFSGYVINKDDREVLKVKQSLYYYLACDEKNEENFNKGVCSENSAILRHFSSTN